MQPKTIGLEQVKTAMEKLQNRRERVSRRNVRQLLGTGGMSTIHKLMREVEDLEVLQQRTFKADISDTLLKAISQEITVKTDKATTDLQRQIEQLQERETEALENLTEMEEENIELKGQLKDQKDRIAHLKQKVETEKAVSEETIDRLEDTVQRINDDRNQLAKEVESSKIEITKVLLKLESSELAAGKAENMIDLLRKDLQKLQSQKAEIEKKYAASIQKATDLREVLSKAEKRTRFLEQKMEINPAK